MKINRLLKIICGISLIASLSLIGCLEEIDLDIPKGTAEDALVIQASLIKGNPSVFDLTVTRLFDFTPDALRRINVLRVDLSDEDGNSFEIEAQGTGIYRYEFFDDDPNLKIEVGKSYKLRVAALDGRIYESSMEPLLPSPSNGSLVGRKIEKEFIVDEEEIVMDSFIQFSINTDLRAEGSTENSLIRWSAQRVFRLTDDGSFIMDAKTCYITENLDVTEVKVFDGSEVTDERLENFDVFDDRLDYHFSEGYYAVIIQEALSAGAFRYWSQVSEVLSRDGNMFETPAGKIKSNFTNINDPDEEAFGYFYAASTDTIRLYVSPSQFGERDERCPPTTPPPPGGGCGVAVCCDCLSAEFSTTIQPEWWIE